MIPESPLGAQRGTGTALVPALVAVLSLIMHCIALHGRRRAWHVQQVKQLFPRDGSKATPPHPSADFKWKDYCPMAFRQLREVFNIDPGDYMLSICGAQSCLCLVCCCHCLQAWP